MQGRSAVKEMIKGTGLEIVAVAPMVRLRERRSDKKLGEVDEVRDGGRGRPSPGQKNRKDGD